MRFEKVTQTAFRIDGDWLCDTVEIRGQMERFDTSVQRQVHSAWGALASLQDFAWTLYHRPTFIVDRDWTPWVGEALAKLKSAGVRGIADFTTEGDDAR